MIIFLKIKKLLGNLNINADLMINLVKNYFQIIFLKLLANKIKWILKILNLQYFQILIK